MDENIRLREAIRNLSEAHLGLEPFITPMAPQIIDGGAWQAAVDRVDEAQRVYKEAWDEFRFKRPEDLTID